MTSAIGPLSQSAPALDAFEVTPSNDADLAAPTRGLLIQTPGDLHCITAAGQERTFPVPAGQISIRVTKIFATGTDADGITALV